MIDAPLVRVPSISALSERLANEECWASWVVRCHIGPEWIGGGRRIEIAFEGSRQLDPNSDVHALLVQALVTALEMPETLEHDVIHGEGQILLEDGWLHLDYQYSRGAPYADCQLYEGKCQLLKCPAGPT